MLRLVVTPARVDTINAARAHRTPCTLGDRQVGRWLEHALPVLERESRVALALPPATPAALATLGEGVALTVRGGFLGLDRAELAVLTDVLARHTWAWFLLPLLAPPDLERAGALETVFLAGAGAGLHLPG